jgi:hypothetical protein
MRSLARIAAIFSLLMIFATPGVTAQTDSSSSAEFALQQEKSGALVALDAPHTFATSAGQ